MRYSLLPMSSFRFPALSSDFLEDVEEWLPTYGTLSGLSISEDDKNVYVEAAVPGVDPKDVEVTFDKGVVAIRAEKKEEEKGKKFHKKATSHFYYRVAPADVDWKAEPTAVCKDGIMKVTFPKSLAAKPKKIAVKAA